MLSRNPTNTRRNKVCLRKHFRNLYEPAAKTAGFVILQAVICVHFPIVISNTLW